MARDERQQGQTQERENSALGTAMKIGAVIGAGAMGWRYRSQIGSGMRSAGEFAGAIGATTVTRLARNSSMKNTVQDMGAFAKALSHAADTRGVLSHISNPGRFEDRFNQSLQYSLEAKARMNRSQIGGEPLQFLEDLKNSRKERNQVRKEVFESHRLKHIEDELGKTMPEHMKGGLAGQLANGGTDWLYNMTKGKVTAFTESLVENKELAHKVKFVGEAQRQKFEDSLFETLKKYETRSSEGFTKDPAKIKELRAVERKARDGIHEGYIKRNEKKDDVVSKFMAQGGWYRATMEDLKMHKSGNLLEGFDDKTPIKDGRGVTKDGHVKARMGSKASKLMEVDPRYRDVVADPHLWINARGEFNDTRWMARGGVNLADGFRQNVQVPFLRFNPLDLIHFTTWEGMKKAPKTSFRKIGSIDPGLHGAVKEFKHPLAHNQDAAVGTLARNYMNTADGKVMDLTTGDIVKEDVYQGSARFGMLPRSMASMANLHTQDYRTRTGFMGTLANIFDIGKQETESIGKRMLSTFSKFDNYEWGPNVLNGMKRWQMDAADGIEEANRKGLSPESGFKLIYSQLESKAVNLSDDTSNYINSQVKKAYGDIDIDLSKLNTEEEIFSALGRLNNAIMTPGSNIVRGSNGLDESLQGMDKLINDTYLKYANNPTQFKNNQRILPNNAPYMPEWLTALDMHEVDLVEKVDDVKRLIHMHSQKQLEYAAGTAEKVTVGSLVRQGIDARELPAKSMSEVRNLETLSTMRQWWDDVYKHPSDKEATLNQFASRALDETDALSIAAQDAMTSLNPKWAMGPGDEPPQYFGFTETISMNKAKGHRWAMENYNKQIADGVSPTAAMFGSVGEVLAQPFGGRRNTGNVTTATLPFYYLAERLDNAVSQLGVGLSQKNRGSMQSILTNQFARRIVLPYATYQQAVWLDGMTGDFFSDKAAETYANAHEDLGWIKEFTGLNDIGRQWSRVFSGGDQLTEAPIGKAFNFATLGFFEHKSGEEIRKDYESGETAIRKGRYWGIGSNTPYTGGKVDRYVPNWYRRAKSDYKFSENMYGSESEYWANNWMPTITNPLAPIRHFFLDPYHYEKKHEEDRPYPMSGGFAELDMIPLVGPALNNTVGRVFKPRREHPDLKKAHREYLKEINDNITAQYEMAAEGGMLQGMPGGGFAVTQGAVGGGPDSTGVGTGEGIAGTGGEAAGYGGIAGVTPEQYAMMIGAGTGSQGASGSTRQQLAAINSMYSEIGGPSLGATGKNVRSLTALEDLRDPDVLADLKDIGTMHSASGTARDSFYSLSEMAGIYGFLTKSGIGFQESGRGMTLEQSTRMGSYARAFWDMELGGLGGNLSEIGRRYNPRDPNKNYWNPIKNKMPEWLPGAEYFTDFKHGDPYVKIANGEMRLPGEAYEKLYKLHPDALGEYGAFDRFRILADVAPYSENYKFYRQMISKMNGSGLLSDEVKEEYAEIRDQVSTRKDKHRFYNRRFKNADVQEETVTITRMIDATTFLTKEHGNNAIRMAGVKVKSDDQETIQWLQQYVHEGAKVKIAVDADPLFRVRDDTFNTMRAVVYANKNDEYMPFYSSTRGQNVNFMLANRKSGGLMGLGGEIKASVHDDGSATATAALFSKDMLTVGKMWETLTHDILPTLPIVGTIADKFLQVRSPLEMYKRTEVYGKAWRPWTAPIEGWIQPMFENMASHHPIVAAAQGAGIGWLFAKKGNAKFWGSRIGAVLGGGVATARVFIEQGNKLNPASDNPTWLPERRRKEREINEYFDKLKYVKYMGLYERARREALSKEGVDIEALLTEHEERGGQNKAKRKTLESLKKQLSMNKKLGYGDKEAVESQLDIVRTDLKAIEADRPNQQLGRYSMLALRYKAEYESTLHGADENGDMTKIFRALPNKDREFFTEFMKAAPSEREEILRMVPKDQRRFYQAKWGMDVDEKDNLRGYFNNHHLPDENWDGWKPDTSLENYKIKIVKNEGLEMTEFGFWGDDEKRAEASEANILPMRLSALLDVTRLEKALKGAGLTDVSVSMNTAQSEGDNKINLSMDFVKDRSTEIVSEINNNLGGLFA